MATLVEVSFGVRSDCHREENKAHVPSITICPGDADIAFNTAGQQHQQMTPPGRNLDRPLLYGGTKCRGPREKTYNVLQLL